MPKMSPATLNISLPVLMVYLLYGVPPLVDARAVMNLGMHRQEFPVTLVQEPRPVASPGTVIFKCSFQKTRSNFSSVIWSKGTMTVLAQMESAKEASEDFKDVVDIENSTLTLATSAGQLSEARLVMYVTRCSADVYTCLVADAHARESRERIPLQFEEPIISIEFDNRTFNGTNASNVVHSGFNITHEYALAGMYSDAVAYADTTAFSVSGFAIITQGKMENITEDSSCSHTGQTGGGSIIFLGPGQHVVKYEVHIGEERHVASVSVDIQGQQGSGAAKTAGIIISVIALISVRYLHVS